MNIDFVIPVFNEDEQIQRTHDELVNLIKRRNLCSSVIYINDGSTDSSEQILNQIIMNSIVNTIVINLRKNYGQHCAVLSGMEHTKAEHIITCDADLQTPVKSIEILLDEIKDEYDIISGWRVNRDDPLIRKVFSLLLNKQVSKIIKSDIHDIGCMLKIYHRKVVEELILQAGNSSFLPTLALKLGFRIVEKPILHTSRKKSSSKYNIFKLIRLYFNLISEISPLLSSIKGEGKNIYTFFSQSKKSKNKIPVKIQSLLKNF